MFADPEIPVRMADPFDVEVVPEIEARFQLRAAQEFVENDPVIDAIDPNLAPVALIEKLAAALSNTR